MERIGKSFLKAELKRWKRSRCLNESMSFHLAEALDVCSIRIGNKVGEESLEYKLGRVFEYMAAK